MATPLAAGSGAEAAPCAQPRRAGGAASSRNEADPSKLPILAHQLSMILISLMTLQPRMQLLLEALSGDTEGVAAVVYRGAALVGLCDLVVSPSLCALSDRVGRRPLMLVAAATVVPLRFAVVLRPSAFMLLVDRVVSDFARTFGGTTMAFTCFADRYQGSSYTKALDDLSSVTGWGIVVGPLISAALQRVGGPRRAYIFSGALAAAHVAWGYALLEETSRDLAPVPPRTDLEQPLLAEAAQPTRAPPAPRTPIFRPFWQFLRLFVSDWRLCLRSALAAVHFAIEGKILQDQVSILQVASGWNVAERSRWTSGLGVAISVGGSLVRPLRRSLGQHGALAACHAASAAAFWAFRRGSFWQGLLLLVLGQQRRAPAAAAVVDGACASLGVGRGQAVSWMASLRAAVDWGAAPMWKGAHSAADARGRPCDVFLLPLALTMVAEALRILIAMLDRDALSHREKVG